MGISPFSCGTAYIFSKEIMLKWELIQFMDLFYSKNRITEDVQNGWNILLKYECICIVVFNLEQNI